MSARSDSSRRALRAARNGALLALIAGVAALVLLRHRTRTLAGELNALEARLRELVAAIEVRREPIPEGLVPTRDRDVVPRLDSLAEMSRRLGPAPDLEQPGRVTELVGASLGARQLAVLDQLEETSATGAFAETDAGSAPFVYEVPQWAISRVGWGAPEGCLERAVGAARLARGLAATGELGEGLEAWLLLQLEPPLVACAAQRELTERRAAADALLRLVDQRRPSRASLLYTASIAQSRIDDAWRELDSTYAMSAADELLAEAKDVVDELEALAAHEGPLGSYLDVDRRLDAMLGAIERQLGVAESPGLVDPEALHSEHFARLQLRLLATMLRAGPAPVRDPGSVPIASEADSSTELVVEAARVRAPGYEAEPPYDGEVAIAEPPPPAAPAVDPATDPMAAIGAALLRGEAPRGSLDREVIRQGVRRGSSAVRACYQQALDRVGVIEGRLTVRFTIGETGAVRQALVDDAQSEIDDPQLRRCLLAAVRALRFPAPEGGGIVLVSYPFEFDAD